MVRPERFELPTYWFVASRSIQLSYGRMRKVGLFQCTRPARFHATGRTR
jgi:hypothetical protein